MKTKIQNFCLIVVIAGAILCCARIWQLQNDLAKQHDATERRSSFVGLKSLNSPQANAASLSEIIIDNTSATVTGAWSTGISSPDKYITNYHFISAKGTGANSLKYTPTIAVAGNYNVYEWHPQGPNRSTDAPIVVKYNGGTVTNRINQTTNGGTWVLLGTYNFAAGTTGNVTILDNFTAGSVVLADAVKFVLSH